MEATSSDREVQQGRGGSVSLQTRQPIAPFGSLFLIFCLWGQAIWLMYGQRPAYLLTKTILNARAPSTNWLYAFKCHVFLQCKLDQVHSPGGSVQSLNNFFLWVQPDHLIMIILCCIASVIDTDLNSTVYFFACY